ncbi:cytochrome P450 [Dichomitus squalens LYAD-421 SS1]|uniref:cytochrome P450 n=1 Tax=Dichomitus squalens (strain LYAD-421) TaxID=732165 RepID=UPI0004413BBE|nr:cytochrome P450 [Dichomitus squalens LYAD-421 SS1]EJF63285.1 cytochrome P450 [Dichomitus squalens LYAD-421 SS1]
MTLNTALRRRVYSQLETGATEADYLMIAGFLSDLCPDFMLLKTSWGRLPLMKEAGQGNRSLEYEHLEMREAWRQIEKYAMAMAKVQKQEREWLWQGVEYNGPYPLPIIGNLFDVPKSKPWIGFRDICMKYGDVIFLRTQSQSHLVLNSRAAISELLDKRTANTSDRLVCPSTRLVGGEWVLGVMSYGARWRSYRRAFWQHFRPGAIDRYRPVQLAAVRTFLGKLLHDPENLKRHINFTVATALLKITYGIEVEDEKSELLERVDTALDGTAQIMVPGRFAVDYIPLLEHVPAWFPGAGYHDVFKQLRSKDMQFKELLLASRSTVSPYGAQYHAKPIVDILLSKTSNGLVSYNELAQDVTAVALAAGADTSMATLQATFLALSLYPEVQKKAQAELDAVVGPSRLPNFGDRDSLVYVNAIVKESFRWFTVTPLGISHCTVEDDEFRGYFIPAGTVLTANIWAVMHDPNTYENPDEFYPERFIRNGKLDPNVVDPSAFVFGSGRRICPGRYFADASLFLNVASILHAFHISPPVDQAGQPIKVGVAMSDRFIS